MPSINKLYEEFKDEGWVFLAIDLKEDKFTVSEAVKERGYTFPVLLDLEGKTMPVYGVRGTPTVFLIDKAGNVVGWTVGPKEWDSETGRKLFNSFLD